MRNCERCGQESQWEITIIHRNRSIEVAPRYIELCDDCYYNSPLPLFLRNQDPKHRN